MEKHKCKTCLRSFTNGRALGGHMRSHVVNQLNISKKELPFSGNEENFSISSSSSEIGGNECSKSAKIWKNKLEIGSPGEEMKSWVSETNPDEEIAYCLIMLKRDSWERGDKDESSSKLAEEKQSIITKSKAKYKCGDCGKVFKSYQALGGHRASHKKGLLLNRGVKIEEKEIEDHQCSVCFKSFSSGQALGGHKRSHFSGSEDNCFVDSPSSKKAKSLIDLNFPPPVDDDDDEISQIVSQS